MPLIETQNLANVLEPPKNQDPVEEINDVHNESPSFWSETIPAAFERENGIVSNFSKEQATSEASTDDYTPDFKGYEEYASSFSYVFSKEQENAVKRNIDREKENEKVIEDSGWLGTAALLAAGILDPINLIPVGGVGYRAFRSGNILRGALSTARSGLLTTTISESALHASQETRTLGESASNVAVGTLLSGVLGGSSAALRDAKLQKVFINNVEENVNKFLTAPEAGAPDILLGKAIPISEAELKAGTSYKSLLVGEGGSVGAAEASIAENKLKSVLGLDKLDMASPIYRGITSPSLKMRQSIESLAETPWIYEKNSLGVPTQISTETIIKSGKDVAEYSLFKTTSDAFEKYSGSGFLKTKFEDKLGLSKNRLTFDEFKVEIDRAMRNNDISAIPEVSEAAKKLRQMVDKVYKEAVDVGIAPKVEGGPKGAPSWMRRLYDKNAINKNRFEWEGRLRKWFKTQNPELDDLEIEDLIQRTTNNILGMPDDVPVFQLPSSGPFKERVFDIPDNNIQDFLIQDIDLNLNGYFKKAITEIELKKAGFDNEGFKKRLEDIASEYNEKNNLAKRDIGLKYQEKLKNSTSEKTTNDLIAKRNKEIQSVLNKSAKNRERDIKILTGIRDRIRGTFQGNSNSILHTSQLPELAEAIKNANYIRLMGQVVFSSLSDIGMPILVNGLTRMFRDQMIPFVRELSNVSKFFKSNAPISVKKQVMTELKDMGIAIDYITNTRVKNFAELGTDITGSKLSKFNAQTSKSMTFLSGISVWNDIMKSMSGYSAMARILRASEAKSISKSDIEFLSRFGIGTTDLKRIGDQFKKYGKKGQGRYASGSNDWDDPQAYKVFQNSIRKFVDQTIITPGQEKPFFMSTTWGSVFTQFKSFAFSSYSKIFIAGMQQRDMAVVNGALSMVGLGMMSYYLKEIIAGREPSQDIGELIIEGVDKSGLLGHMFDVNQTLAKGGLGISEGPVSRYKSRSGASSLAGPSFGLIEDAFITGNWIKNAFQGNQVSSSDIHATRRIMPFQNLITVRKLFDMAEENIASAVGATPSNNARKRQR